MHHSTDSLVASISLSLWLSERKTQRLPKVRTYGVREIVALVSVPAHLASALPTSSRFEGI